MKIHLFTLTLLKTFSIKFILLSFLQETLSINYKQLNYNQRFKQQSIVNSKQNLQGKDLFGSVDSPNDYVSTIGLSGWFFLRKGIDPEQQLLSVTQKGVELFSFIYSFDKNLNKYTFSTSISSAKTSAQISYSSHTWFFFKFQASISSNQLKVIQVVRIRGGATTGQINSPLYSIGYTFSKQDMILNIAGNPLLPPGVKEANSFSKDIFFYWDVNVIEDDPSSYYDDYSALQTQLIWNYDFFYSNANQNSILNVALPMNKINNQIIGSSKILILQKNTMFKTDYINAKDFGGVVVSFHFKVVDSFTNLRLFTVTHMQQQIYIEINNGGEINLNGNSITGLSFNKWTQVTIVIKTTYENKVYLIIDEFESLIKTQSFTSLTISQLEFGSNTNLAKILISHIRYYKGAYLTKNQGSCLLQASRDQISCVICQSGYLNYQGNLDCISQTLPIHKVEKDNIIDWNDHDKCPVNMVYMYDDEISSMTCKCLFQFYNIDSNTCGKCPKYCNGCTDSVTCIEKDYYRLPNGKCQADLFDDGYSCIDYRLVISSRDVIFKTFSNPELKPQCDAGVPFNVSEFSLYNSELKLNSNEEYSFFFSFAYNLVTLNHDFSIAYLKDEMSEIFTFVYQSISSQNLIIFEVFGEIKHTFSINTDQTLWISIWTNFQKAVLLFHNHGQFFTATVDLKLNIKLVNPIICVGPCKSEYHLGFLCGTIKSPLIFIKTMTNPSFDLQSMKALIQNRNIKVAKFQVDIFGIMAEVYNNKLNPTLSLVLDFQNTPHIIDRVKGYGFTQQTQLQILGINFNKWYWITFSCSILPVQLIYQVSLLVYQLDNNNKIQYFLVPQGQRVFIRICYQDDCKDTQYSMLFLNEWNTLFIIMRLLSPFTQGIHYIEFEVVSNYQRELIQFLNISYTIPNNYVNLKFYQQMYQTEEFLFYMNAINIHKGSGIYYFDYIASEKCFLFAVLEKMECLLYKKGYLTYNNLIITEEECLSYNEIKKTQYIIIESTRECIDTQQIFSNCKTVELINNVFQCVECKHPNMLLIKNCECIEGYYQDSITKQCFKCHPKCLTCVDQFDNCILCLNSDQLPPTCNCIDENQYHTQTYSCQTCSQKCEKCEGEFNKCTSCADRRVNPPSCNCIDSKYIEVDDVCIDIVCHLKCQTCNIEYPANQVVCNTCKKGRMNPPLCECFTNYKEESDGTCSPCLSSYYYNLSSNECLKCSLACKECINYKNYCTSCNQGLKLYQNECICENNLQIYENIANGQYSCKLPMDVQLSVKLYGSYYQLILTFDEELFPLDFETTSIKSLFQITLNGIQSSSYSFSDPLIQENQLILKLKVVESFQSIGGKFQFLITNSFISKNTNYVLKSSYLKTLLQFEIGPYIFSEQYLDRKYANLVMSTLKSEKYQNMLTIIQQSQLLFYLLNTAQPTALFLLVKANFPPNLYIFYQTLGTFVFPSIVDYQSKEYNTQQFQFLGYKYNQTEVKLASDNVYQRIGLSNSFLVNVTIIIIKYTLILILLLILSFMNKLVQIFNKDKRSKLLRVKVFLLQYLNEDNETNLLLITISIMIQFTSNELDLWSVRYGYYLSFLFLIFTILSFYQNYIDINYGKKSNPNLYSVHYINRIPDHRSRLEKNYFLFQLFKKYLSLMILFTLVNHPYFACAFNGMLFIVSSCLTIYLKPYNDLATRIVKIIGEFIYSVTWFLHILILTIEEKLNRQSEFNQETIDSYLFSGKITLLTLLIFNFIFFTQYLIKIYNMIIDYCQKRKLNKKSEQKYLDISLYQINQQQQNHHSHINVSQNYSHIDELRHSVQ